MVKDYFDNQHPLPITLIARHIIPPINRLISVFRQNGWPVIFSTDAFDRQDFFSREK
jgi:nicotinamidase-related amidase